jgi:integrase
MAKVFRPNAERLKSLGYARLAHVPVLFDAKHRYCREHNWYLRDRATRAWHPSASCDSFDDLSASSLLSMAYWLGNFIEWCDANSLDWTEITYDDIVQYQDDQADGSWSTDGRRLGSGTVNHRADEATNFLLWAAFRKLRPPFEVKAVISRRIVTSGASSQRGVVFRKVRAGRKARSFSDALATALMIPSVEEIAAWLSAVRGRRGYVKYLACRFILEGGPRRHEVEQITDDLWPSKAVLHGLQARGMPLAPVALLRTKGGRPRTIQIPLAFASEVREWVEGQRLRLALAFFKRTGERTRRLFLSDRRGVEGRPISAQTIYDCFREVTPRPGRWHPHLARHTHACLFLLQMLDAEAKAVSARITEETRTKAESRVDKPALANMGADWINSRGTYWMKILRRQLGHASEETTEIYLRWIITATQTAELASGWHSYLNADAHDRPYEAGDSAKTAVRPE